MLASELMINANFNLLAFFKHYADFIDTENELNIELPMIDEKGNEIKITIKNLASIIRIIKDNGLYVNEEGLITSANISPLTVDNATKINNMDLEQLVSYITTSLTSDTTSELSRLTTEHIYKYYSQTKQLSDNNDMVYYKSILTAADITDIDKQIVFNCNEYYDGAAYETLINDFDDNIKFPMSQILKAHIRFRWIEMCKTAYRYAVDNNTELTLPEPNEIVLGSSQL